MIKKLIKIFKEDPYELLILSVIMLCGLPQNLFAFLHFLSEGNISFLLGKLIGDFIVCICYAYYVIIWVLSKNNG